MEFENMTMEQVESRVAEIQSQIDTATDEQLTAFTDEMQKLNERKSELRRLAEQRKALKDSVASFGTAIKTPNFETVKKQEKHYDASSPEYRTAWLKNIATDMNGRHLFGPMTESEKRAFTFTTENTGEVVPTEIINKIVDLIDNDAPMYDDAFKTNFSRGFSVPRLKEIKAGDAKKTAEGVANDDEEDDFDPLDIVGVEIRKHIVLTRKMEFNSIDAFENWLVTHLANRIRVAKENYIITQLNNTKAGIDTSNIMTGAALTDAEIRNVLSKVKGSGERVLYANQDFIWNTLAGVENESGDKLFIPNPRVDPVVEGSVYGTLVKKDSNIPDDTFYIGYPNKLDFNEFIPTDITPQIQEKTLNRIFVGYSLCGAGLEDPKGFVKWSKSGGAG